MIDSVKHYFIDISNQYENKSGYNYWDNHVKYVTQIAGDLAKEVGADLEIVEISAILHDVAKVLELRENESHNLVGVEVAENLLLKEGYDPKKIEKVKKCILYHSGDLDKSIKLSKEEWCVRNADIISMFHNITIFFFLAIHEYQLSYNECRLCVKEMIQNKYHHLDTKLKKQYDDVFQIIFEAI